MIKAFALAGAALLGASGCSAPGPSASDGELKRIESGAYSVFPEKPRRIRYLRAGTRGGDRVIFVHGTPGEAKGWADYLLNVPDGAEYYAVDRPGFGGSSPSEPEPDLSRQAAALLPLLSTPDKRPVVLVGHSYGGAVVAQAAMTFPDRVLAIVILAGSLDPEQERIHPLQHVAQWWGIRHVLPSSLRNANVELLQLESELRQLAPGLGRIRASVTIVHGTSDRLVPFANADWMQPRFTGASSVSMIRIAGQGHFLPWERKAEVDRILAGLRTS